MSKVIKNPTLFVDIDGTLVEYRKFSELSESILTTRVILNDKDPENPIDRAVGINLDRNGGLKNITIPESVKSYESN